MNLHPSPMAMSTRRSSDDNSTTTSSSPEFDFWMLGNHPQHSDNRILSADELIVDGVLLPLHLLSISNSKPNNNNNIQLLKDDEQVQPEPEPELEAQRPTPTLVEVSICSASTPSTGSKRWKDLFKVVDRKKDPVTCYKYLDRKKGGNQNTTTTTTTTTTGVGGGELNINIWPFSRSRSAGTAASGRPKLSAMRKSSSAPCSRSNSRGEGSAARRWAASPGRPGVGVHVGRASPVWQVRRAGPGPARSGPREKVRRGGGVSGGGARGLNLGLGLSVNSCIGYGRAQGRCRGEDRDSVTGSEGNNNGGGSLFRFRALFSKKVY